MSSSTHKDDFEKMIDPNIQFPDKDFMKFSKVVNDKKSEVIPCVFYPRESSKLILYFHGNAEDIHLGFH
jgi:hypothetical protein